MLKKSEEKDEIGQSKGKEINEKQIEKIDAAVEEAKEKEEKIEQQEIVEGMKEEAKVKKEKKSESELKRIERTGIANIFTSFNNTIVHITDLIGNSVSRVSGGMMTKHDRLKANPTVAMFVAKRAAEIAKEKGIENVYVRIRAKTNSPGLGPGAHAAVKSLGREKMKIINILDVTKIPRGGPKKKGGKRGRRV